MLPQCGIERFLTRMAERGMAYVMRESKGLSEFAIQAQRCGERAGDLGDFERVGEATAEVVCGQIVSETREDLGLSGEAPERAGVKNAGCIAREGRTVGVIGFGMDARSEIAISVDCDVAG
jgi:hypothetical protein